MSKQTFVILEQNGNGDCYIATMEAENIQTIYDEYESMYGGDMIVLTKLAFERLARKGGKIR